MRYNSNSYYIFYPFAVETAGMWHEMATELTQIGRHITTVTEEIRETTFLFHFLWLFEDRMQSLTP